MSAPRFVVGSDGSVIDQTAPNLAGSIAAHADVSTAPNTAVFGSQVGAGPAETIANSVGGKTLSALLESRGINMPDFIYGNPESEEAWAMLSARFTAEASGTIHIIIPDGFNEPTSTWTSIEFPTLVANSGMTSVVRIDPVSGVQDVIYSR